MSLESLIVNILQALTARLIEKQEQYVELQVQSALTSFNANNSIPTKVPVLVRGAQKSIQTIQSQ